MTTKQSVSFNHDATTTLKRFLRYWPSVRGIHRWPIHSSKPVTLNFDISHVVSLKKLLNKQSSFLWFGTSLYSCDHYLHLVFTSNAKGSIHKTNRRLNAKFRSLEALRYGLNVIRSLGNLTGVSTTMLPRRLPSFIVIRFVKLTSMQLCQADLQSRGFETAWGNVHVYAPSLHA